MRTLPASMFLVDISKVPAASFMRTNEKNVQTVPQDLGPYDRMDINGGGGEEERKW